MSRSSLAVSSPDRRVDLPHCLSLFLGVLLGIAEADTPRDSARIHVITRRKQETPPREGCGQLVPPVTLGRAPPSPAARGR